MTEKCSAEVIASHCCWPHCSANPFSPYLINLKWDMENWKLSGITTFYRRRCCILFCSIWYCLEEQTRLILQTQIDLTPQRNKPSLACCPLALRLFLFNTWSDTEWCQCHCCQWRNIGYKTVRRPLIGLNHSEPFWTILNHSEPFWTILNHSMVIWNIQRQT